MLLRARVGCFNKVGINKPTDVRVINKTVISNYVGFFVSVCKDLMDDSSGKLCVWW